MVATRPDVMRAVYTKDKENGGCGATPKYEPLVSIVNAAKHYHLGVLLRPLRCND